MSLLPLPGVATGGAASLIDSGAVRNAAPGAGGGFASALRDAVEQVNQLQQQSGVEIQRFLTGEGEDLHQTALAVQKADLAFEMLLQVRNKVVDAYQEIMRIQV
jgi:flagellar hook-basal body complex protein FliE